MPRFIENPTTIEAAGIQPKIILEYVGRVNSRTDSVSVAHMKSPPGWVEPGQRPEFTEYTLVLSGELQVTSERWDPDDGQGRPGRYRGAW